VSTVLLLSGASQGDALGGIARSFKTLFNAAGYEFTEIHFGRSSNPVAELNAAIQGGNIAFAFSFMSMGSDLTFKDNSGTQANLWERLRIPFISIYGDSPAYYFDRHVVPGPNFAGVYGFPEHTALRLRLPKINGPITGAAPILLDMISRDALDFTRKSAGKLLFLKNGNDPEALRQIWRERLQAGPLNALQEMAAMLAADLASPRLNQIDDVVLEYCAAHDIDIARQVKLRLFFIAQLDDYTRRLKSTLVAQSLLDLPIEVRGTGWGHVDFTGRRATLVESCDYAESRQLIREALGVLDMSPNTSGGPHDRVSRAFGSYTLCVTNEQAFLARDVPAQNGVSFRFEAESIQAVVGAVLTHPARHVELGAEIAAAYRDKNPPEAGIADLIRIAELVRLNQAPGRPEGMPPYFVWPPRSLS
jgi:hypothetical protein